jgi:16S rRNA (cytidine1402-2'-O)-methyltransferase
MVSNKTGTLFIVATPIGNLSDLSYRAVDTLKGVDLIAAEDTRHSRPLLQNYGIDQPMQAYHEHNEGTMAERLVQRMEEGESIALISDAGTPLISDPGYSLVRRARESGITVTAVPGASAIIAALSISGLPTDSFTFYGFMPRTSSKRRTVLTGFLERTETSLFYESSHRILATLEDVRAVFPLERKIVVARELTKLHETVVGTTVGEVCEIISENPHGQKGEFVVLLEGTLVTQKSDALTVEQRRVLTILLKSCSVKTASELAAEISGARKKLLYQEALKSIE